MGLGYDVQLYGSDNIGTPPGNATAVRHIHLNMLLYS